MCAHSAGFSLFFQEFACVQETEQVQAALKNPIKGDMYWSVVLFKAFWDISRDVSFNVGEKKQKNNNKKTEK